MHIGKTILPLLLLLGVPKLNAQEISITPQQGPTLLEAFRQVREMRRLDTLGTVGTVTLHLHPGTYRLSEVLTLRSDDHDIIVKGDNGTFISGAVSITGWRKQGKFWVAKVPEFNGRPLEFRQLWVNGAKAVRARDVADFEQMHRIRAVDKQQRVIWVPAKAVRSIMKATHAEMVLHEMWCVAVLRIKHIKLEGDSAAISFHEPESRIQFEHPWPSPMVTTDGHNSAFYLTNALELLDTPGEWYLDINTRLLYYLPREGEDMKTALVEAPMMETLLRIEGTQEERAHNIRFENITFSHTTWRRPSFEGHVPLQAGMYLTDAYKLRPQMDRPNNHKLDNQGWLGRAAAAVEVTWAENCTFSHCAFTHLGGSGLDLATGDYACTVERCDFDDIAMNGCVIGSFSPAAHETHKPYRPHDERSVCRAVTIRDCRFHDITNDDWGCVAIAAGYVANTVIAHNEISEVSYTGISMGWGWNRDLVCMHGNRIHANLIHHYAKHMYDVAGIYTLGNQPGTIIDENVVSDIYRPGYVHDPNHWFYLYTDEGSANITVRDNWCPEEKFLQNANGPGNIWQNNGPMVSSAIKAAAGITKDDTEK